MTKRPKFFSSWLFFPLFILGLSIMLPMTITFCWISPKHPMAIKDAVGGIITWIVSGCLICIMYLGIYNLHLKYKHLPTLTSNEKIGGIALFVAMGIFLISTYYVILALDDYTNKFSYGGVVIGCLLIGVSVIVNLRATKK